MEVLIAVIGTGGAILSTIISIRLKHKLENEKTLHTQERVGWDALSIIANFTVFNKTKKVVDRLMNETSATRFLYLIAVNGKHELRHVSVIYEQHKTTDFTVNAINRYQRIKVDDEYLRMLKRTEKDGPIDLETETMSASLLKDIYSMEGIKHSRVTFVHRVHMDAENDLVIFSSIASHDKDFTSSELTNIDLTYEGTLKPIMRDLFKSYPSISIR